VRTFVDLRLHPVTNTRGCRDNNWDKTGSAPRVRGDLYPRAGLTRHVVVHVDQAHSLGAAFAMISKTSLVPARSVERYRITPFLG
jgi:hypothetical protein